MDGSSVLSSILDLLPGCIFGKHGPALLRYYRVQGAEMWLFWREEICGDGEIQSNDSIRKPLRIACSVTDLS